MLRIDGTSEEFNQAFVSTTARTKDEEFPFSTGEEPSRRELRVIEANVVVTWRV